MDKPALITFSDAIRYISKDSLQNAVKVKKDILAKINELSIRPEIHVRDKYKRNNPGDCRAFELHRYRIAYFIKEEEINYNPSKEYQPGGQNNTNNRQINLSTKFIRIDEKSKLTNEIKSRFYLT